MNSSPVTEQFLEVWVFNGNNSQFPSAVFTATEKAEEWIQRHNLSGTLTLYHVDEGAYDWSIRNALFSPHKPHHSTPDFIGRFAGGQRHFHYEDGQRVA
jgi:hypothetical protein